MRAKYVNPFTDFGFKKIFGEEASKPILLDFLNALLPQEQGIKSISFKNTELLAQTDIDRKVIYDIYCENERGEKFIVELQKAKQNYFIDRTVYYSTFPIREQAEKGNWNYKLMPVYCIGILDFTFSDYENESDKHQVVHEVKLKDQNGKLFYDKLTYIYIEMPNFNLHESELKTQLDKWLYFIKNLEDFQSIPVLFKDEVFVMAFDTAEISNFRQLELDSYEGSLKIFRDNKNTYDYAIETAHEEGMEQGIEQGLEQGIEQGKKETQITIAKELKLNGVAIFIISKTTGLTEGEINKL